MAVYVELRYKAFHQQLQKQTENLTRRTWNVKGIRRPLNGIEVKEDTYGFLRVVTEDGKELTLSGYDNIPYASFLITHWEQPLQEKMSVLETMGDTDYLYFYGRKVRTYSLSGVLLNTEDFNWRTQWLSNYDKYLRGSQLAKSKARLYLYLDGSVIEGYLANTNISNDQGQRNMVSFTTTVMVTDYLDVDTFYTPEGQPDEYITGLPDGIFPSLQGDARKAYGWTYADALDMADSMIDPHSDEHNGSTVKSPSDDPYEDEIYPDADPYRDDDTSSSAKPVGENALPTDGKEDSRLVHPSDKRSMWAVA